MKSTYSKYIIASFTILMLVMILIPSGLSIVSAQTTSYTPLAPLPDVTSSGLSLATTVNFKTYVSYTFNLLIALGAVAAVFMITWGGFDYMTTDAVQGKTEGLSKIQNAIYGLLLILSSWLILRTIDPRFVYISATLVPPLKVTQGTNNLANWYSQLSSEIATFNSDQTTLRNQLQTAYAQQTALQTQGTQLANNVAQLAGVDVSQIDSACSSNTFDPTQQTNSALSDACTAYYDNLNQQQTLQSSTTLAQTKGVLDTIVNKCGTTGSTNNSSLTAPSANQSNCYSDYQSQLDAAYNQFKDQLNPSDQTQLTQYLNYSKASFYLDEITSAATNYKLNGGSFAIPFSPDIPSGSISACSGGQVIVSGATYSQACTQQYISAVINKYSSNIQDQTLLSTLKIKAGQASTAFSH